MLYFPTFGCATLYIYIYNTDVMTVCGHSASWRQFSDTGERNALLGQDGCPSLYV
jgi:hypothetical protein